MICVQRAYICRVLFKCDYSCGKNIIQSFNQSTYPPIHPHSYIRGRQPNKQTKQPINKPYASSVCDQRLELTASTSTNSPQGCPVWHPLPPPRWMVALMVQPLPTLLLLPPLLPLLPVTRGGVVTEVQQRQRRRSFQTMESRCSQNWSVCVFFLSITVLMLRMFRGAGDSCGYE